jgi:hypothetical protein
MWGLDSDPLDPNSRYAATNWLGSYAHSTSYIYANCEEFCDTNALSDFPGGTRQDMPVSLNMSRTTAIGYPRVTLWARNSNYSVRVGCNLERHFVDLQALCNADACIVKGIKPTTTDFNYVQPATVFNNTIFAQIFFDNMLLAAGRPDSIFDQDGTVITQYLHERFFDSNDNPLPWMNQSIGAHFNWTSAELSSILSSYINTYMQASQPLANGTSTPPVELFNPKTRISSLIDGKNQTITEKGGLTFNITMNGTQELQNWPSGLGDGAIYNPRYNLDPVWIAIDLMTCLILICAATFSIWLRLNTVAPDIFGCKFIVIVMITSYSQPLFQSQPHLNHHKSTTFQTQNNHNQDSITIIIKP